MYGGEGYETLVASETKIETDRHRQTDRQTHGVAGGPPGRCMEERGMKHW